MTPVRSAFLKAITVLSLALSGLFPVQVAQAITPTTGLKPSSIISDGSGNTYVGNSGDGTITKIDIDGNSSLFANLSPKKPRALIFDSAGTLYASTSTGTIFSFASDGTATALGKVGLNPIAMSFDAAGNLYTANYFDNNISKLSTTGIVSIFATVGSRPTGMVRDSLGNLYTSNSLDGTISKVTTTGVSSVFANVGGTPSAIVIDATNNLYVTDNTNNTVIKVTSSGVVSTLATVDQNPVAITIDSLGNLYTANFNANTLSKVSANGQVSTFAITGNGPQAFNISSSGTLSIANSLANSITQLKLNSLKAASPSNLTIQSSTSSILNLTWNAPAGAVEDFLLEATTNSGKKIVATKKIGSNSTTFAFTDLCSSNNYSIRVAAVIDGVLGELSEPVSITMPTGAPGAVQNLIVGALTKDSTELYWDAPSCTGGFPVTDYQIKYSTDQGSNWTTVSHVKSVDTFIAVSNLGLAKNYIFSVAAVNSSGIGPDSSTVRLSPTDTQTSFPVGVSPTQMVFDAGGNLYVANSATNNVSKITAKGIVSTFATVGNKPGAMVVDQVGNLFVANFDDGTVSKVTPTGVVTTIDTHGDGPTAIVLDSQGNILVANSLANNIVKISPDNSATVFAELPSSPKDMVIASNGDLFTVSSSDYSISRIATTGIVSNLTKLVIPANRLVINENDELFAFNNTATDIYKISAVGTVTKFATLSNPITDLIAKGSKLYVADNTAGALLALTNQAQESTIAILDYTINRIAIGPNSTIFTSADESLVLLTYLGSVPSAPKNLTSSSKTQNSISLSWQAPDSNGGATISNYNLEFSIDGQTWQKINRVISTTTSFTVTNLQALTNYNFRVSAVNALGESPTSNVLSTATLASKLPEAPNSVSASSIKTTSAVIKWSTVASTIKVTNYSLDISVEGGAWIASTKKASTLTSFSLTSLKPGANYRVRVAAINAEGKGEYAITSFKTLPTVSSAPQNLKALSVTSSSMSLDWVLPANDGGAEITDYVIEINGGSFKWTPVTHNPSIRSAITINDLKPATKYGVRVKAINEAGISKATTAIAVLTMPAAPNAPTNLKLKSATATSITLTWTAPSSNGSRITDYLIEYSPDQGTTWLIAPKNTSASTTITIKALKTKTTYLVRVSAKNGVGLSTSNNIEATATK